MPGSHKKEIISKWLDLLHGLAPIGEIVELPVLSGSMMPLLPPDKTIRIRVSGANEVRTGDVVVFKEGKSLTTHRILIKFSFGQKMLLYQKGDANRFGSWLNPGQIAGTVIAVEQDNGTFSDITTISARTMAEKEAMRQLIRTAANLLLFIPRVIKRWLL